MKPHDCKTCSEMKAKTQARSRKAVSKADKPLGLVHIDLVGPFPTSIRGYRSAALITDSNTSRH